MSGILEIQVLKYDYYGSYDTPKHTAYEYDQRLQQDYSFELPRHFEIVRVYLVSLHELTAEHALSVCVLSVSAAEAGGAELSAPSVALRHELLRQVPPRGSGRGTRCGQTLLRRPPPACRCVCSSV